MQRILMVAGTLLGALSLDVIGRLRRGRLRPPVGWLLRSADTELLSWGIFASADVSAGKLSDDGPGADSPLHALLGLPVARGCGFRLAQCRALRVGWCRWISDFHRSWQAEDRATIVRAYISVLDRTQLDLPFTNGLATFSLLVGTHPHVGRVLLAPNNHETVLKSPSSLKSSRRLLFAQFAILADAFWLRRCGSFQAGRLTLAD